MTAGDLSTAARVGVEEEVVSEIRDDEPLGQSLGTSIAQACTAAAIQGQRMALTDLRDHIASIRDRHAADMDGYPTDDAYFTRLRDQTSGTVAALDSVLSCVDEALRGLDS